MKPKEISNPVIKINISMDSYVFREIFKINLNHTYKVSNTHGNILVNENPNFTIDLVYQVPLIMVQQRIMIAVVQSIHFTISIQMILR